MTRLKLFAFLIIMLLGVTTVAAQESTATPSNVAITLERTACFGRCPVYSVTILDDGTVLYKGERSVDVTGEQTSQIDPTTVQAIVEAFDKAGYFDWKETYDHMDVTDLSTVITSVTRDGVTHRISRYLGDRSAPLALAFLEQWIDEMAGTGMWTGVPVDVSAISDGSSTPVVTIQRDPCFGRCPVYTAALYQDGTVVYTGIANVSEIGVRVLHTDASAIASLVQQAQALGYFDWQASYDHQVRTDQATVITSISGDNQFQRIARYGGDPNAPVGLLWIEQSIDQLVTSLVG